MSKQYGLIVPNKNDKRSVIQRPSIFDDDSDSEQESSKPTGLKTTLKRQDRVMQEKAFEEDPTVFQYDEIYDEMDKKRKESKLARKDIDKKPKYINKLLAAADKRKKENERRIERQVQKEREAEGETFKDKESFVTTAYRKKLEEIKALEDEEKREEYLETIGDVKKQGNLDGFYRHLYDQKVNYEDQKINNEDENDTKEVKDEDNKETNKRKHESGNDEDSIGKTKTNVKGRKYRKRDQNSEDEDKEETENIKKEHLPSNLDADSDFSIDSESEDEGGERAQSDKKTEVIVDVNNGTIKEEINNDNETKSVTKEENQVKEMTEEIPEIVEKKAKIDIWKKRTVGEIFDAALQRYFERKSLRESG